MTDYKADRRVAAPVWVSIEGVNGVGKTYLTRLLGDRLGATALLVSELTDGGCDLLSGEVVTALSAGRSFLRTGNPLTETMALLALKIRAYERVESLAAPPAVVIEDRGVDTVAAYQAPILADGLDFGGRPQIPTLLAELIYQTAAPWRPLPHRTVLLVDDLDACARRFTDRERRCLADDERALVAAADDLYRWRAEREPDRFRVVDRGERSTDTVVDELERIVRDVVAAVLVGGVRG